MINTQVVKEQTQTTILEFIAYINALNIFLVKIKSINNHK